MNMPFSWWRYLFFSVIQSHLLTNVLFRPVNTLAQMVNMPKKNAMEFLENDKETALILQVWAYS